MADIPYRPSNGTECELFIEQFCDRCSHQGNCHIADMAFWHELNDPLFPKAWVIDEKADASEIGRCTAFEAK